MRTFWTTCACLAGLLSAAGVSAARAFEVSGFSFTDLHVHSEPPRSSHSRDDDREDSRRTEAPRETFHAFTPAELAQKRAENNARYEQAMALMKPVPASAPAASAGPGFGEFAKFAVTATLAEVVLAIGRPEVELLAKLTPEPQSGPPVKIDWNRLAERQPPSGPLVPIGAVGAAKGEILMVVPGGHRAIPLKPGQPIFANSHITTAADSRVQFTLSDQTVFTMGPNSEMVLDDFVYDPKVSGGRIAARVTKGVFRFVTGKVARSAPENMKVILPTGVCGPRGTEFVVSLDSGQGRVQLPFGGLEIERAAGESPLEMRTGQSVSFRWEESSGGSPGAATFGDPVPIGIAPAEEEIAAAARALSLLRAAAAEGVSDDDRAFLEQQAGAASAGAPVLLAIPPRVRASRSDALRLYALETDLAVKLAAYGHYERLLEELKREKADVVDATRRDKVAEATVRRCSAALRSLVESRADEYVPNVLEAAE